MKYKSKIITFVLAVALLGSSCISVVEETLSDDSYAISFQTPQTKTRAAIDEAADMTNGFSVWGWYSKTDAGPYNVFNGVTVEPDNGYWKYDETQYWIPGWTYDFYAVYPSGIGNVSSNGVITVEKFDCSATGTDAIDLMTASATNKSYTVGETPQPVPLNFNHLLSRIDFVGKSVGGSATVHSVTLSGITTNANCNTSYSQEGTISSTWSDNQSGNIISSIDGGVELEELSTKSVVGDIMIIPQTLTENSKVTITYSTDTEENKSTEFSLNIENFNTWEAGKAYKYSFEVTGGGYIIFNKPSVNNWNTATGGNVIIDVTQ